MILHYLDTSLKETKSSGFFFVCVCVNFQSTEVDGTEFVSISNSMR